MLWKGFTKKNHTLYSVIKNHNSTFHFVCFFWYTSQPFFCLNIILHIIFSFFLFDKNVVKIWTFFFIMVRALWISNNLKPQLTKKNINNTVASNVNYMLYIFFVTLIKSLFQFSIQRAALNKEQCHFLLCRI